jgi:hypothetical protein
MSNKRLERTRHKRASLLSCVGELLKRNVGFARSDSTYPLTSKMTPVYIREYER